MGVSDVFDVLAKKTDKRRTPAIEIIPHKVLRFAFLSSDDAGAGVFANVGLSSSGATILGVSGSLSTQGSFSPQLEQIKLAFAFCAPHFSQNLLSLLSEELIAFPVIYISHWDVFIQKYF